MQIWLKYGIQNKLSLNSFSCQWARITWSLKWSPDSLDFYFWVLPCLDWLLSLLLRIKLYVAHWWGVKSTRLRRRLWSHMQLWIKLCDFGQVICLLCFIFSSVKNWWTAWPSLMLHIFLCFHPWVIMRAASSCTFIGRGLETIFLTLGSRNSKLFSSEDLQEQALNTWVPWWSVALCRKSPTRLFCL